MHLLLLAVSLTASQASGEIRAPENAKVVKDVTECRSIADPKERLACFDAASQILEQATETREVMVVERKEVERTRRKGFGFALPDLFGGGGEDQIEAVSSTILAARPSGYARWQVWLEDGTVWTTSEAAGRLQPRKGDPITIKRAALGSFLAKIDDAPLVRISRVE